MRIFYDHQVFSLQDAGGAARYYYELIKHLQVHPDVQVDLQLGLNRTIYPFQKLRSPRTRISGKSTPLPAGPLRYSANEIVSSCVNLAGRTADVYHPTLYRASSFVRRRRTVATHYDCAHEIYPALFRRSALVIRNKRELYSAADAVLCISESSRRDLLKYYDVDPARVFVVYLGFAPLHDDESVGRPDLAKRPYVLFVGFRGTYKNFETLLRAYVESGIARDYDLLTVGGGALTARERFLAEQAGITDKLKNVLRVSDALLARLYKYASLFVYPSLHEGFGFPPLEAMSMGCPVLANAVSSMPEICGDAAYYFSGEDLSSALVDALNSDAARSQLMKKKGYERVLRFDWARTAAETHTIYSNVLNN